jgi:hypothetical protein
MSKSVVKLLIIASIAGYSLPAFAQSLIIPNGGSDCVTNSNVTICGGFGDYEDPRVYKAANFLVIDNAPPSTIYTISDGINSADYKVPRKKTCITINLFRRIGSPTSVTIESELGYLNSGNPYFFKTLFPKTLNVKRCPLVS